MSAKLPSSGIQSPAFPDETPEYPLSSPIKPDDPERRSDQSRAETEGCVEEQGTVDPQPRP